VGAPKNAPVRNRCFKGVQSLFFSSFLAFFAFVVNFFFKAAELLAADYTDFHRFKRD
jgi:hypothetical protein